MLTFTQATGSQMVEMNHDPVSFWINSMGEYGHRWEVDGQQVESIGGSVNFAEFAAQIGKTSWEDLTPADRERAYRKALHDELVHPVEFALHRAHRLLEPLGSDLWRFYAGIEYGPSMRQDVRVAPKAHTLEMQIEYAVPQGQRHLIDGPATNSSAKVEYMTEHDDDRGVVEQYAVIFDVRGKGVAEVADLQVRWLLANDHLHPFSVSVM